MFLDHTDPSPHAWIILSDPARDPDDVILVNFSTHRRHHEQTCVVEPGAHPFLTGRSCVIFGLSRKRSLAGLEQSATWRQITMLEPASPQLLAKIYAAVPQSRMNQVHLKVLDGQGLIG